MEKTEVGRSKAPEADVVVVRERHRARKERMAANDLGPDVEHPLPVHQARAGLEAEVKVPARSRAHRQPNSCCISGILSLHVVDAALDTVSARAKVIGDFGRTQAAPETLTGFLAGVDFPITEGIRDEVESGG